MLYNITNIWDISVSIFDEMLGNYKECNCLLNC